MSDESYQDQMNRIKSRSKDKGVVARPPMPPLDAEPIEGPDGEPLTMAEQAPTLSDVTNPLSPLYDPDAVPPPVGEVRDDRPRAPFNPLGGQMLPPEARKHPDFRPGPGSMLPANQPESVRRAYMGQDAPRKPGLSPETQAELAKLHQDERYLGQYQEQAEETQQTTAKAQAREQKPQFSEQQLLDQLSMIDPHFMEEFQKNRSVFDTPELKKATAERCAKLTIDQLVDDGESRQLVPIVRDKLIAEFRTISGAENLGLQRKMVGTRGDLYIQTLFSLYQLTCALVSYNGKPLLEHRDADGKLNEEAFEKKFDYVQRLPVSVLASLSVNNVWFVQRTEALLIDLGELKNGS